MNAFSRERVGKLVIKSFSYLLSREVGGKLFTIALCSSHVGAVRERGQLHGMSQFLKCGYLVLKLLLRVCRRLPVWKVE